MGQQLGLYKYYLIYRTVIGYITIMAHLLPYEVSWGGEVLHEGRLYELWNGVF